MKFLRRVPIDPMTRGVEWGLRSYQDKPDATRWGGQNVFDVHTTFDGVAHGLPPARTQGHGAQRITEWRSGEMTRTHNAP